MSLRLPSLFLQLICLSDLEQDYMNPHEACTSVNNIVLPEYALQAFMTLVYTMFGHWVVALIAVPMTLYNANT